MRLYDSQRRRKTRTLFSFPASGLAYPIFHVPPGDRNLRNLRKKTTSNTNINTNTTRNSGDEARPQSYSVGLSLGHFLHSRIPPVENGPFRLDFFSTGFFWSLFLSSDDSIL